MPTTSRIQRWRQNKRQQGLKHVSVWLTNEEELRLKDLALQERRAPSEIIRQAFAQYPTPTQDSNPTDTLRIRKLILAEMAALGMNLPTVTGDIPVGCTVGPTDTEPQEGTVSAIKRDTSTPTPITDPTPTRKGGRPRSPVGQQILALLADHPEGLTAEQIRVYIKAEKPLGDTLQGMKRLGTVRAQGQGQGLRYILIGRK